jgi:hypothetical protein
MAKLNILSKPDPHPLLYRLKNHKIPLLRVSYFLKVAHSTLYLQVAGYKSMDPEIEQKLKNLLQQIEQADRD